MNDLKGKNIIVTGASGGIGNSIIEKLNQSGVNILASGTRIEKLEELKGKYKNIKILKFDISQSDKIEEFIENATKELGGSLDCIVNNAGITKDTLLMRMSDDDWDSVIQTNLKSVYKLSQAVLKPMMKKRSGRIINISSVVGHMGNAGQVNYAATKAGIAGFTKSLAQELGSRNITVNCVAPGFIDTDMTKGLNDEHKEKLISLIPLSRLGNPEDVAKAVCFLASDDSSYITGETIHVNGGMLMV